MAEQQLNELQRKVRYLLSQRQETVEPITDEFVEMLRSNRQYLESMFELMQLFIDAGVTNNEIRDQIVYGEEARALKQFEREYTDLHEQATFGSEVGTFMFERDTLTKYHQQLPLYTPENATLSPELKTGLLLIPLPYTTIQNTGTSTYFDSSNDMNALNVTQNENGPLFRLVIDQIPYSLQGMNARILGTTLFTRLIQQRLLILEWSTEDDVTTLYNVEATIDVLAGTVTTETSSDYITLNTREMLLLLKNLPPRIKSVHNIFSNSPNIGYDIYKRAYTTTLIRELVPQVTQFYFDNFGNTLMYGLMGQGAAVSIAQLYNLAESTIRQQEVRYSVEDETDALVPPVYVDRFIAGTSFDYPVPFNENQVFGMTRNVGISTANRWRWENVPINMTGIDIEDNMAILTDTLANTRFSAEKFLINKDTSNSQTTSPAWIETRYQGISNLQRGTRTHNVVSVSTGNVIDPVRYKLNGIAGGNINVSPAQAEFYGLNLLVRPTDQSSEFDLNVTQNYNATMTQIFYLVIKPDDLSSESTNSLRVDITWKNGNTRYTQDVTLTPQRIQYGTTSANAYVGLLRSSSSLINFSVKSTARFTTSTPTMPGHVYPSNFLSTLEQSTNANAFNAYRAKPVPYATTVGNLVVNVTTPGIILDGEPRYPQRTFLNAPFCWQSWWDGFSTDYGSAYLTVNTSIADGVASEMSSPLYMQNNVARFTVSTGTHPTIAVSMYGYTNNAVDRVLTTSTNILPPSTVQTPFSSIVGWTNVVNFPNIRKQIVSLEGTVTELSLPEGIYNVFTISEAITDLRTAVALLQYYALYLEKLIENLNDRLTIVERTMESIIDAIINIQMQLQPNSSSFGGDMLSFLGTSIGMFFPLTGLAINIFGNLFGGIEKISDGNVLAGTMDIATGALMSALGIRKFRQRMDRKYGATEFVHPPVPPIGPPSYESLFGKPGFNTVGTNVLPRSSSTLRLSSGVTKNSLLSYLPESNASVIKTILMQQGLHNSYRLSRSNDPTTLTYGTLVEVFNATGDRLTTEWNLVMSYYDRDFNIRNESVRDDDFTRVHGTNVTRLDYVKRLHAFSQTTTNISDYLAFEDETLLLMGISNLSIPNNILTGRDIKPSSITYYDMYPNTVTTSSKSLDLNKVYSPMSMTQFADSLNPYNTDKHQLAVLFDNMNGYVNSNSGNIP